MRHLSQFVLASAACVLLTGCIPGEFTRGTRLDDLKFVSVDDAVHQVLRVHFTTSTDLAAFTRSRARSINVSIVPCRSRKTGGYLDAYYFDLQGVYDRYGEIANDERAETVRRAGGGSRGDYFFYIASVAPPPDSPQFHYTVYDLRSRPEDMCAYMHGGGPSSFLGIQNVPPFYFTTNDVVVPETAIRAALAAKN